MAISEKFRQELSQRITNLKKVSQEKSLDLILIFDRVHLFYFTGLFFQGFLFLSKKEVRLYVKRPWSLTAKNSLFKVLPLRSFREIKKDLANFKKIGIDRGGRPFFKEGFSGVCDIEEDVLRLRMIKSPYEISCIRRAGRMLKEALKEVITSRIIRPRFKEIEASAFIESALRRRGHPGITRSYHGFELGMGHFVSGKSGLVPIIYPTGQGGKGVSGFPGGASFSKLKPEFPILIDFSGFFRGYYIDQTRMASFKKLPYAEDFYKISLKIHKKLERSLKPGITCEEAYFLAEEIVEKEGVKRYFMKHGDEPIPFVGHGVGLQIDEPPALARGVKTELKEGMVISLEPKFHVDSLGVIGVEDTYLVTLQGLVRLTSTPRKWIYL